MTTTTPLGFPKPEATDRIALGYDQIADLADALDAYLAARLADTGWVTAGLTLAAGWSDAGSRIRKIGSLVMLEVRVNRTGVAVGSPATGDMANTNVLTTIPTQFRPANLTPMHWICDSSTDGGGGVNTDGSVSLYSMNPTATIPVGGIVRVQQAWYV